MRVVEDLVDGPPYAGPLPDGDEIANIDETVGKDAVDRRAHRGEFEIPFGPGERGAQFLQLGAGLGLLGPRDLDIVACRVIGRLRRFHRRQTLVAAGFGHLEGRARGQALGAERLLAIEIEGGPFQAGGRRGRLTLGLVDRAVRAERWSRP